MLSTQGTGSFPSMTRAAGSTTSRGTLLRRSAWRASSHRPCAKRLPLTGTHPPLSTCAAAVGGTVSNLPKCSTTVRCTHTSALTAVISYDVDPVKITCAAHNAAIYNVADKITFVEADILALTRPDVPAQTVRTPCMPA